jgi:predicted AlkP superfamily pyrophosphatase or phosphodiesterase
LLASATLPLEVAAQGEPDPLFFGAYDRAREKSVAGGPSPRLAVVVIFDMLRSSSLDRMIPLLPDGGLRRLYKDGAVFTNCTIPYCVTKTGPGHATVATGASPWLHGIVDNAWFEAADGQRVNCVQDSSAKLVGATSGRPCSPWRLEAPTVADMLRGDTRGLARVIAVAGKDRSAVLSAGHHANGAYWLDGNTGLMMTSSFYVSRLPGWAQRANGEADPVGALDEPWEPLLSEDTYLGTVSLNGRSNFPHLIPQDVGGGRSERLLEVPYALDHLFRFARAAVEGETLGQDAVCDLLVVGVSATDLVGHRYGPDSAEYLDMCARADRELAGFLSFLDREVGRGNYLVAVTADHGVATTPAYADFFEAEHRDSVGSVKGEKLSGWCRRVLDSRFEVPQGERPGEWLLDLTSGLLTLNLDWLAERGIALEEAVRTVVDSATANPWLAGAYSPYDSRPGFMAGPLVDAAQRNCFAGRSGHLVLIPAPLVYFGSGPRDHASHGSPYRYDTQVPLILYGWGIREGLYSEPVSLVDIAPTLSVLLGVRIPSSAEGEPLQRALRRPQPGWEAPAR